MTTTAPQSASCDVPAGQDIIEFVHGLGGEVDVVGYDAEGDRVGVIVNPITDIEVEVVDPAGLAVRLVATLVVNDEAEAS